MAKYKAFTMSVIISIRDGVELNGETNPKKIADMVAYDLSSIVTGMVPEVPPGAIMIEPLEEVSEDFTELEISDDDTGYEEPKDEED